jgi:integrase/recombinase XerD
MNPEDAGQMFNMGLADRPDRPDAQFAHGLRASELVNLTDKNIVDGRLDLQRLKGICHTSKEIAHDPLEELKQLAIVAGEGRRLFHFTRSGWWKATVRYCKLAGIDLSKEHPHALKHSIAMQLWESTKDLGLVQLHLGHRSAGSTSIYSRQTQTAKSDAVMLEAMKGLAS